MSKYLLTVNKNIDRQCQFGTISFINIIQLIQLRIVIVIIICKIWKNTFFVTIILLN